MKFRKVLQFFLALAIALNVFLTAASAPVMAQTPTEDDGILTPEVVSDHQLWLPLIAKQEGDSTPVAKPLAIRKLVITQDAAVAAAEGVAPVLQCRNFDRLNPSADVASAGPNTLCVIDYVGYAVVCDKDHNPQLCAYLSGEWWTSSWQTGDENLPTIANDTLSSYRYERYFHEDSGTWKLRVVQTDAPSEDRPRYAAMGANVGGVPGETWELNLSRHHALREWMEARAGQAIPFSTVLASVLVMFSDPTLGAPVQRGTLWGLCSEYWPKDAAGQPADVWLLPVDGTFRYGVAWVKINPVTTAEGTSASNSLLACMQANDAEWTTWPNFRALLPAAEKKDLDDRANEKMLQWATQTMTVGVGAWGQNPELQQATVKTVTYGIVTYAMYLLATGLQSGAAMVP